MTEQQRWQYVIKEQIKDASHRRIISTVLKNFCNELLEIGECKFDLIYSSSRAQYKGVRFRGEVGSKTLAHLLKNYGKQVFSAVKKYKRI